MSLLFGYRMSGISAASRGICIVAASVVGVFAGQAQEDDTEARQERVVVTGSRIANFGNLVETSPVTSIGAPEFDARGVLRVEDMVNTLPQAFGAQGANLANGATATASVDLRGLGSSRTLVLLNGRRLPYGATNTAAADLNFIPSAMIERVDILTGGASAVYGSDAMAGVVNFVLKDDFEGIRLDANYSFYQHDNSDSSIQALLKGYADANPSQFTVPKGSTIDGQSADINIIFGGATEDGKASFTGFFGYRDTKQILQGNRDYSQCALGTSDYGGMFECNGSSTNQIANIIDGSKFLKFTFDDETTNSWARVSPDGEIIKRDFATDTFNYNPYNHYQRPIEQYSFAVFSKYRVNSNAEAYFDFMYSDNRTNVQIAPSGVFGLGIAGDDGGINCNNVFFSDQQRAFLCGAANYSLPKRPSKVTAPPDPPTAPPEGSNADEMAGYLEAVAKHETVLAMYNTPTAAAERQQDLLSAQVAYDEGLPQLQEDYNDVLAQLAAGTYSVPISILRRNVEGGNRNQDINQGVYLARLGLRGDIPNSAFSYDAHFSLSTGFRSGIYNNDLSKRKIANALNAVADEDGNPVCAINADNDPANNDPNCVAYDIWSGNAPDAAAVAYIVSPLNGSGSVSQLIGNITVSGSLEQYGAKFPAAADAVAVAVGVEYRQDSLKFSPDAGFQSGDGAGQGGPTPVRDGSTTVSELFGEASIPIAQDLPNVYHLGLSLAYRYSNFGNSDSDAKSKNDYTYKIGLDYSPVEDVRFRGSFQRAVRAADIFELLDPQRLSLVDLNAGANGLHDPCASTADTPPAATREQCANTGVTAAQYGAITDNPAGQYNTIIGGDPKLLPETAQTYTIGFVASPRFLPNLTVSVDYFNIKVLDYINEIDATLSISECISTGDPFFCSNISRGNNGTLWLATSGNFLELSRNTGSLETTGFDILLRYDHDSTKYGNFTLDYVGTVLSSLITTPVKDAPDRLIYDCVGLYGGSCGAPKPSYRHKFSLIWEPVEGSYSVSGSWRHFNEAKASQTSSQPALSGSVGAINVTLPTQNYFDLSASYSPLENLTLRAGVNNVFDSDPPLSSQVGTAPGNGNTYPQVYDALGRYIFTSATVDF